MQAKRVPPDPTWEASSQDILALCLAEIGAEGPDRDAARTGVFSDTVSAPIVRIGHTRETKGGGRSSRSAPAARLSDQSAVWDSLTAKSLPSPWQVPHASPQLSTFRMIELSWVWTKASRLSWQPVHAAAAGPRIASS